MVGVHVDVLEVQLVSLRWVLPMERELMDTVVELVFVD